MMRARRYSLPDYIFPKPWVYLIASLLLLNLAALAVLGVLKTPQKKYEQAPMQQEVLLPTGTEESASDGSGSVWLEAGIDKGQHYIDSMVFFGESTTAHLRSRGVLSGGRSSRQVWANESNTMMLSPEICKQSIIYPETGERMTVVQAAARKQPEYLVLSFGVNGLSLFADNPAVYSHSYAKLITAIREASPATTILLQTVYPVAKQYPDAVSVNQKITQLNALLPEIAAENAAFLVDSASVLRDDTGMLRAEYAMADGLHLTSQAYAEILQYLRTHGCP